MKKIFFKRLQLFILAASAAVLAAGCASFPVAGEDEIARITELINGGNAEALCNASSIPFLLDAESLHSDTLVESFWTGLVLSGFRLENTVILEDRAASPEDSERFGTAAGTEFFFKKHLPKGSVFLELSTDQGNLILLLGPNEKGRRLIMGWGGPY